MAQREITEIDVERTLIEFHVRYTDKDGNPIFVAKIDSRRIKVVIAKDSEPPKVITTGDL
jgi:Domain of unknown function (DUF4258)